MRVSHVITRLIVGGAQENTVASVLGLAKKPGVEVNLLSGPTHGPEGSLEGEFSTRPEMLAVVPNLVRQLHPAHDFLAFLKLTRIFRDYQPDIVHTHSGKAGILGRLAARRAAVPVIIHTIHGPSFGPFQGSAANWLFRNAERYATGATTHFITVANAMTQQYLSCGIAAPENYTRIFSGFNLAPFLAAQNDPAFRQQLGIAPDEFVIGKIARLFKLKGHDDLFQIAPTLVKRCPKVKFLLVGDGPYRQQFEARVRMLGLEKHFIFIGLVRPDEVPRYIGIMDALVHLSRREGLARALPQALAAAKPVVAYDCDGASEVCIEDQTGFLIPPGNLEMAQKRLLQLANNRNLSTELGKRGQAFVRDRFPTERMVDEIFDLYQKLLVGRRGLGRNTIPVSESK